VTHAELVDRAMRWLKNSKGCSVAFSEFFTYGGWEIPDAIGWQSRWSCLVECKVSRADFLVDQKKPFRLHPWQGLGSLRYYMAPVGVIRPEELPEKWGLLEVRGRHVRVTRESEGFAARNRMGEVAYLVSMLRRAQVRLGDARLDEWLKWENRRVTA
jgi:hypothetical protein